MTQSTIARGTTASQLALSSPTSAAVFFEATAMSELIAQWLRGLTINAHERLALSHLWEQGPMTMSELGARIPLSRAAVTALTDRLEALGYVRRTPDEHDRRRTVLSVTPRPARLIDPLVGAFSDRVSEIEAGFTAEELAAIQRYQAAVRELAHRHADRLRARSDADLPVSISV
jgi:DNA-binding MarR family transcriptional regulator